MEFICEALDDSHDLTGFDSTNADLDTWLKKSAHSSDGRDITRTYVWHTGDRAVTAYYTLMPYVIEQATLTKRQGHGLPRVIPGFLLARLALDRRLHGQRLGSHLLASALQRAAEAAGSVGGRFVVVDAIDDAAVSFYVHHGFEPIEGRPDRLIMSTKALTTDAARE